MNRTPEQPDVQGDIFGAGSKPADEQPGEKLSSTDSDRRDQGREVPGFNHEGYAEAEIIDANESGPDQG